MMCVMLVTELGVPWRLRNVPISVACEKYWIFCGVIYLICVSRCCCAHRMNDIVHSLSISLTLMPGRLTFYCVVQVLT